VRAFVEAATVSLLADVALARLSFDPRVVRCRAALASIPAFLAFLPLLSLVAGAACSPSGDDASSAAGASGSASAPVSSASWSREALAPRGGAADPVEPAVMDTVDPGALDDLLAATPKIPASASARPAIGADTGIPAASASPVEPLPPDAKHSPRVVIGMPTMQPPMAAPAIERAGRAQLYWNLVQRCRDKDGKILPPDAITLRFIVDGDGYIKSSSIVARATRAEHADAAHCMRRELSTATFRGPAANWGHTGEVHATVPSVD
jgi:hypothetical protein